MRADVFMLLALALVACSGCAVYVGAPKFNVPAVTTPNVVIEGPLDDQDLGPAMASRALDVPVSPRDEQGWSECFAKGVPPASIAVSVHATVRSLPASTCVETRWYWERGTPSHHPLAAFLQLLPSLQSECVRERIDGYQSIGRASVRMSYGGDCSGYTGQLQVVEPVQPDEGASNAKARAELSQSISQYLRDRISVEGDVTGVEGDRVQVRLRESKGMQPGDLVFIANDAQLQAHKPALPALMTGKATARIASHFGGDAKVGEHVVASSSNQYLEIQPTASLFFNGPHGGVGARVQLFRAGHGPLFGVSTTLLDVNGRLVQPVQVHVGYALQPMPKWLVVYAEGGMGPILVGSSGRSPAQATAFGSADAGAKLLLPVVELDLALGYAYAVPRSDLQPILEQHSFFGNLGVAVNFR